MSYQAAGDDEAGSQCTCEELDLFGWTPLVECVGPALRLCLHHRIVIVPITYHHDNRQGISERVMHGPRYWLRGIWRRASLAT